MAALSLTTVKSSMAQGAAPVPITCLKLTQNDWINLPGKGFIGIQGIVTPVGAAANVLETLKYGAADVKNAGTAYTATDTSLVFDGMGADATTPRVAPYYIQTGNGEIMEVIGDSAPTAAEATLTVRRGCLGTTASATGAADNDRASILNQVVLGNAAVGAVTLIAFPLSEDAKAKVFGTAPR